MSRIVITTIGSLGDLYPMIAIAKELRQRHHSILFATHARYQETIEQLGFEFQAMRPDLNPTNDPEVAAQLMDLKTGTQTVMELIMGHVSEAYADLKQCTQQADVILAGEGAFAARLISEKTGIPWVSVVLQPAAFLSIYDMPVLPVLPWFAHLRKLGPRLSPLLNKGVVQLARLISKSWSVALVDFRETLKLPPLQGNPLVDNKYSPYLSLAMFSPVFAQAQSDWPLHTVLAGFPFYDVDSSGLSTGDSTGNSASDIASEMASDIASEMASDASKGPAALSPALEAFLAAGEPPIVFTLGSAAVVAPGRFYVESVQAARQLNRRAVLLIGDNPSPEPLPESVFAINYVPHAAIFSRACAVVHQGGIGTTAQALRSGKPTLIVPYSHDQPDNADRAAKLGTSVTVKRDRYTAKTAARALQTLLEQPDYKKRADAIGRQIRGEDGVKVACDAVESLLMNALG